MPERNAKRTPRPTSDEVIGRLTALHPKKIDLSLGRIERLLAALGNPERRMPPAVHVTGTNGKGSVIAHLRAMLEAAGYRVNAYTSPHLISFNERIRTADGAIGDDELIVLLEECEAANGDDPITFFEMTTACAFLAFARSSGDITLIENGLGGRLDATNVLARPLITVITPVSRDHVQFLGDTIEMIAGEKAGILKPGVGVVIGPQTPVAAKVLADRAGEIGAPMSRFGEEWSVTANGGGIVWSNGARTLELPPSALAGPHQVDNAGTAIAALELLSGFEVGARAIAEGLRRVEWPARLERLGPGPLVDRFEDIAPEGSEVWLDGGHNAAAGAALARVAEGWTDKPLFLIVGMLNSKDPAEFLAPLAPFVEAARCVAIPGEQASLGARQVTAAAIATGIDAQASASIEDALTAIARRAACPARVLISGSLYLAGAVLAANGGMTSGAWAAKAVAEPAAAEIASAASV
ncbi:MAG: bifunctional folylpolyglutamate synthase/dihydrofolate synthase [Proteobacteria bacterium]|nr:bifunctional folylpolyglutamate synthase/dihydrofolate synthase [Pseudomonadota bacterium]